MTLNKDTEQSAGSSAYPGDIDLRIVLAKLWHRRLRIVLVTTLFAVFSIIYILNVPNQYQSIVLVSPSAQENDLSAGLGRLSGLASLAGITAGAGATNKSGLALEILKSRIFISDFVKKYGIAAPVVAGVGWDASSSQWEYDSDIFNKESGKWFSKGKAIEYPSVGRVHKAFSRILEVSENKKTGIISISVETYSPQSSSEWANSLVDEINAYMREKDIAEAEESLEYLNNKLGETASKELHQVLYQLIEEQTKKIMLAKARDEYVFNVVDPAIVPDEKSQPRRSLFVLVTTVLGVFIGISIVLIPLGISRD